MSLAEELNIYKDCTELLNRLYQLTQTFPRFFKYGLGVRMTERCLCTRFWRAR
ncbi:hypothetical protein I6E11_00680 [Bacteroides caecigallinarum]|uniref:hypothetical protein n=1 Tax=Bacteroides caecigallinarum TaxID=1411144 RepID=UPI001F411F6A|nr:hypothetical protein [Bacteroides caecigallinarum]MCF2592351.1 hypothetical protein [Bacteroides caecigallinarum]